MNTPSSPQNKVDSLLEWCKENKIWIDSRLEVQYNDDSGIGVYSKEEYIPPGTSIVHIHKNSVLSVRNCTLSGDIAPAISGPEASLALSLAFYVEMLNGRSSRWFGYIQSLPDSIVDLPLFWGMESPTDHQINGRIAELEWLRGTEVSRCLRNSELNLQAINEFYLGTAEPLLLRHFETQGVLPKKHPSLDGFYHAFSLVSSRAFLVDAFHGLSIVPIADAFNHSQENHVHLQTDFDVCPHCGSLQECMHDGGEHHLDIHCTTSRLPKARFEILQASSTEDYDMCYEMVSNTPIAPHMEVFNTYGETLSNPELLVNYGFILDVNDNDRLNWDFESVYRSLAHSTCFSFTVSALKTLWTFLVRDIVRTPLIEKFSESNLVYCDAESSGGTLCVNGDGKISYQLWVLLALSCFPETRLGITAGGSDDTASLLDALNVLFEFQLYQERFLESLGDEDISDDFSRSTALIRVARSVIELCNSRRALLTGARQKSGEQALHEIFDELPEDKLSARYALTILMGELSLLDSCSSGWQEILSGYNATEAPPSWAE